MLARPVVAGRTYLLSRRVTQRQFLLRPDDDIIQMYQYVLAVGAKRYGIALHGWVAMSNHHHVVFTDVKGNYPAFLAYVHRLMAMCVNSRRRRRENVWSTTQPSMVWLVEPADALAKLFYVLTNPVAAGLVARVTDWPGALSLGPTLNGTTLRIDRPLFFFRGFGKMPEVAELEATRLPGFEHLSSEQWKARLLEAIVQEETKWSEILRRENRRVVGRKGVLALDPFASPTTPEKRTGGRPFIACMNGTRRELEIKLRRHFDEAYAAAREDWRHHRVQTLFPWGTYKVVRLGAFAATTPPLAA
jgi:hypothetical protein